MAHKEPQLLTPPSRNDNPQQAKQVFKEFTVDLHTLLSGLFLIAERAGAGPAA